MELCSRNAVLRVLVLMGTLARQKYTELCLRAAFLCWENPGVGDLLQRQHDEGDGSFFQSI